MAKIGTAHVEIKPVLNDEALDAIAQRIEERIEQALALADLGPLVPKKDEPLPLGWSIHLPDANGHTRRFVLAARSVDYRGGEPYTVYELVRHDHFEAPEI